MDATRLDSLIGHRFLEPSLLQRALTHRSFGAQHNERLEFLGDSILNCIIALELHQRFPDSTEGELSRLRANLVNQQVLFSIASRIGLGKQLRLGEGEMRSGGAARPSILADAVEALIGAVMLDGGFPAAQKVVLHLFSGRFPDTLPDLGGKDAKTLLQEYAQGHAMPLPVYTLLRTHGRAHDQTFEVQCVLESRGISTEGRGGSRRAAEQDAAGKAYSQILPRK